MKVKELEYFGEAALFNEVSIAYEFQLCQELHNFKKYIQKVKMGVGVLLSPVG